MYRNFRGCWVIAIFKTTFFAIFDGFFKVLQSKKWSYLNLASLISQKLKFSALFVLKNGAENKKKLFSLFFFKLSWGTFWKMGTQFCHIHILLLGGGIRWFVPFHPWFVAWKPAYWRAFLTNICPGFRGSQTNIIQSSQGE